MSVKVKVKVKVNDRVAIERSGEIAQGREGPPGTSQTFGLCAWWRRVNARM
jgi:hypothetical protein